MPSRTVVARNWATTSDNRIHDDVVARQYGFRGGLVPGVTLFSYLVPPLLEDQGEGWLDGGWAEVRFVSAVYEGDEVVTSCEEGRIELRDGAGAICVSGQVWSARAGLLDRIPPAGAMSDPRPAASTESLAVGRVLGSLHHRADPDVMIRYLQRVGEDSAWWLEQGVAHPGWLLLDANEILARSVVLGPWIHAGSRLRTLRRVPLGAALEVRAEVAACDERKGHQFVELDVATLADGQPALAVRHAAIWQLRPPG